MTRTAAVTSGWLRPKNETLILRCTSLGHEDPRIPAKAFTETIIGNLPPLERAPCRLDRGLCVVDDTRGDVAHGTQIVILGRGPPPLVSVVADCAALLAVGEQKGLDE